MTKTKPKQPKMKPRMIKNDPKQPKTGPNNPKWDLNWLKEIKTNQNGLKQAKNYPKGPLN